MNACGTTDDDDIGSLVSKEDLICAHFDKLHLEEADVEYDYDDSDESIDTSLVETVMDKHTAKFVFDDAAELFLSPYTMSQIYVPSCIPLIRC